MTGTMKQTFVWMTVALASVGLAQQAAPETDTDKPAKDETLVSIGALQLKGWQSEVLIENRAGTDPVSAADFWTTVQLKAAEARRRGLDQTPENQFILNFFRDYFLGNLLDKQLAAEAPKVTEAQARADYDAHPDKYKKPFMATIEHLTLSQRDQAKAALKELQAPDADFNAIYQKYCADRNDRTRGRLYNASWDRLKMTVGAEAAQAVKAAQTNAVLGPFLGLKGFEVIRVKTVRLERMPSFEELKDQIIQQLNRQAQADYPRKVLDELKAKADIQESPRLDQLRRKQQEAREKAAPSAPAGGK